MMTEMIVDMSVVRSLADFLYYASLVMTGVIFGFIVVAEIDERLHEDQKVLGFAAFVATVVVLLGAYHYYH